MNPGTFRVSPVAALNSDRAVVVEALCVELDLERLRQLALGHDSHRVSHTHQSRSDENLKTLVAQLAVRRQILASDIGVDRHLSNFASTGRADEVDRHRAALLLQHAARLVGDFDLHCATLISRMTRLGSDPKRVIRGVGSRSGRHDLRSRDIARRTRSEALRQFSCASSRPGRAR
jgi:hypothetical protein